MFWTLVSSTLRGLSTLVAKLAVISLTSPTVRPIEVYRCHAIEIKIYHYVHSYSMVILLI